MTEERKREIEQEFDEKFSKGSDLSKFLALKYGTVITHEAAGARIKDFIFSLLDTELTKQREVINDLVDKCDTLFGYLAQRSPRRDVIEDMLEEWMDYKENLTNQSNENTTHGMLGR